MPIENKVSFSLAPETATDLQTHLDAITSALTPLLISLTPDQRRTIPKMSDKSLPFVQKTLDYIQSEPQFAPPFISVPDLQTDLEAFQTLSKLERSLRKLLDGINDTAMESGSEAYVASLAYYNSIKLAAKSNIPGAETVYDDLSTRFDAQKGSKTNNTSPEQPAEGS